jgi:hypothetical protein
MTKQQAAKTLIIYHFMAPMLFQAVVDWGWDDENQLRAAALGSFNSVPIFAGAILGLWDVFMSESGVPMGNRDLFDGWTKDLTDAMKALRDAEDLEDYADALLLLSDPVVAAAWGIPTKPFINLGTAVETVWEDPEEWGPALKLAAGFSPYMIAKQEERGD